MDAPRQSDVLSRPANQIIMSRNSPSGMRKYSYLKHCSCSGSQFAVRIHVRMRIPHLHHPALIVHQKRIHPHYSGFMRRGSGSRQLDPAFIHPTPPAPEAHVGSQSSHVEDSKQSGAYPDGHVIRIPQSLGVRKQHFFAYASAETCTDEIHPEWMTSSNPHPTHRSDWL